MFRVYKFLKDYDARQAVLDLDRAIPVGVMTGLNAYRNADGSVMVGVEIDISTWWEGWAQGFLPGPLSSPVEREAMQALLEHLEMACVSGMRVQMSAAVFLTLSFGAPWAALGNAAESIRGGQWA